MYQGNSSPRKPEDFDEDCDIRSTKDLLKECEIELNNET